MTGHLDAAARLADGSAAVHTAQLYVTACQLLGYQHPQLTRHTDQLHQWYGSEDGLDLHALATDSAALRAVAEIAAEVLAVQDGQAAAINAAWQGSSGQACQEVLRRHGDASDRAVAAIRVSADVLAALREELWQRVDRKVTATLAVDGAAGPDWPAAARTVTTGAGDRATASELVDAEVKPFVDTTIGLDWLSVMQDTLGSITAAFEAAAAELSSLAADAFAVPGDLGSVWDPAAAAGPVPVGEMSRPGAVAGPSSGWAAPTSGAAPAGPAGVAAPDAPLPLPPASPVPTEPATAAAPLPAAPGGGFGGGAGGGLPDFGGGFAAVGRQLADMLGGLIGSAGETLGDGIGVTDDAAADLDLDDKDLDTTEEPTADDDDAAADDDDDAAADDDDEDETEDDSDESGDAADGAAEAEVPTPDAPPPPVPTPIAPPPPTLVAEPLAAATPCEIAADELPQAGQ